MSRVKFPKTPGIRYLEGENQPFEPFLYADKTLSGTKSTAEWLGVDEHLVIKSLVFIDENRKGLMVLMHGDCHVDTKTLANVAGVKKTEPAEYKDAHRWTGYEFGGTSPFGIRADLPIYAESTIFDLDELYINGGKRGFILKITPEVLRHRGAIPVNVSK